MEPDQVTGRRAERNLELGEARPFLWSSEPDAARFSRAVLDGEGMADGLNTDGNPRTMSPHSRHRASSNFNVGNLGICGHLGPWAKGLEVAAGRGRWKNEGVPAGCAD